MTDVEGPYEFLFERQVDEDIVIREYTFPQPHPAAGTHAVAPPIHVSAGTYKEYVHDGIASDQDVVLRIDNGKLFVDPKVD